MDNDIEETLIFFDRTGERKIDPEDLEQFFYASGLSPLREEIKKIISDLGNGPITYESAMTYYKSLNESKTHMSKEELVEIFKPFDRDGNGQIMVAEFRNLASQLGDQLTNDEIDQIMSYMEVSAAGTFAYETLIDWSLKN